MKLALIKNNVCTNVAEFESLEDAIAMKNVLGADDIVEISDEFATGDSYANGTWAKAVIVIPPTQIDPLQQQINTLALQMLKLSGV